MAMQHGPCTVSADNIFWQMPRLTRIFFLFRRGGGLLCGVYANYLLGIFMSGPTHLNADCKSSRSSLTMGQTCKKLAWHLQLVSHCTSMLPAVSPLICSAVIYVLNPLVTYFWAVSYRWRTTGNNRLTLAIILRQEIIWGHFKLWNIWHRDCS